MGTILLLDEDDSRAEEIADRITDEVPGAEVRRVGNGVELRYAAACYPPSLVILGAVPPPHRRKALAWEIRALRPFAWIVAFAHDEAEEEELRTLGVAVTVIGPGIPDGLREVSRACKRSCRTDTPAAARSVSLDSHRYKNRVAGLLAGMHAFAAELRATAHDSDQVHVIANEYVDRLAGVIADISAMVAASQSAAAHDHEV